ncbi:HNH endonuclease [Halorubrum pallidum]|uniref:HNH endonuclease n=1 Tax=Halorubrum pallidum TaxID=1526114 RepID=A0ABD5SYL2_9EURY
MTAKRDLTTTRKQVFGDVEPGTECRICGRNVEDGRRKVCSDYCDNIQTAVMGMLNWSSLRRRVIDRDDETCTQCGWDREIRRRAREHIRGLIAEAAGEQPTSPSMKELGEQDDVDWDQHRQRYREWRERRDAAKDKYGDPERDFGRSLEVDHITPIADGGHPFDPGNLQTLCTKCHTEKTAVENSERASTPSRGDLSRELTEFVTDGSGK